jgi:hypothetical protein
MLALGMTIRLRHLMREIMSMREHVGQSNIAIDVALLQDEVISLRTHVFDRKIGTHLCHTVGAFFARRLIWRHQAYPFKRNFIVGRCSTLPIFQE